MGEKLLALALEGPAQAFLSSRRGSLLGLWSREVRLQDWQGLAKSALCSERHRQPGGTLQGAVCARTVPGSNEGRREVAAIVLRCPRW